MAQGTSSGWISTPVQPDCSTIRCTRSRFANANCPGASGRRGGNSGSSGAAARSAAVMNGFSAGLRQAMKRISAPGAAADVEHARRGARGLSLQFLEGTEQAIEQFLAVDPGLAGRAIPQLGLAR